MSVLLNGVINQERVVPQLREYEEEGQSIYLRKPSGCDCQP